jgi:hypothetical protein
MDTQVHIIFIYYMDMNMNIFMHIHIRPYLNIHIAMSAEVESESQPVVRLSDHPVPEHPPPPGHQREQWAGWKAWNRYCSIRTQYEHVDVLNQVIMPVLQHYYRLNESHPGYIGMLMSTYTYLGACIYFSDVCLQD